MWEVTARLHAAVRGRDDVDSAARSAAADTDAAGGSLPSSGEPWSSTRALRTPPRGAVQRAKEGAASQARRADSADAAGDSAIAA
jgi:hypothetical protein